MLTAYASGEQIIGRQIIEEVADNLDLLPEQQEIIANVSPAEEVGTSRVLTPEAREELWNNQSRTKAVQPKKAFKTDKKTPKAKANGGASRIPFDDLDDEINLEIEEVGGFY
jgi:hypothetical protein